MAFIDDHRAAAQALVDSLPAHYVIIIREDVEPLTPIRCKSYRDACMRAKKHRRENGTDDGVYYARIGKNGVLEFEAFPALSP